MTREDIIRMHIDRVLGWDRDDIMALANMLYDLHHSIRYFWDSGLDRWRETDEDIVDYFDPTQLPTCNGESAAASKQTVWAMDRKGNRLISLDFESTNYGYNLGRLIHTAKHRDA